MANVTAESIDKSAWGEGPWQHEPDRVEWEHAGLPCLAIRQRHGGFWCGYAAVPPGHPLHGVNYSNESPALVERLEALKQRPVTDADLTFGRMVSLLTGGLSPTPEHVLDAHGGITYSDKCRGDICHAPKPGEPDDVWWFGWDAAHSGDHSPAYARMNTRPYDHARAVAANDWRVEQYRTLAYVQAETNSLAEQLAALK